MEPKKFISMPILSVIVPVYNGEKYLYECVKSILDQSFNEFELLLIDDGSSDNSGKMCDEISNDDDRVRVIHKDNEGSNKTRQRGVKEACGEWVTFVDVDDSLPEGAFAALFELTSETDLVIGFPDEPAHKNVLNLRECRANIITGKYLPPSPYAKLFRRNLLTDWCFDFPKILCYGEDLIMNLRYLFSITKTPHIYFGKCYNYRKNNISISHSFKTSLEYEFYYNIERMNSIPEDMQKDFMNEVISSQINGLLRVAYSNTDDFIKDEHQYVESIRKSVRESGYKPSILEKTVLYSRNKFALQAAGLFKTLINFSKYRLGLNN